MPTRPPSPCTYPGCPRYGKHEGRCDEHRRKPWDGTRKRSSRPWERKRQRVFARDDYLCQPCKRAGRLTAVRMTKGRPDSAECDHIVALAEGGTDDEGNLETTCHACHVVKTQAEAARGRRA